MRARSLTSLRVDFMIQFIAVLAVSALAMFPASAEVRLEKDGVRLAVEAHTDHVVFCISASGDLKVSSEYGVEFKSAKTTSKLWAEALPKVVTGPPYYFALPLRIELRTRGNAQERAITLALGACSAASNACVPITFEVNIPRPNTNKVLSDCVAADEIRPLNSH